MEKRLFKVLTATILFLIPTILLSQAPNLGSLSSFALFTSVGTFTNGTGGATNITGNVGTNSGSYGLGGGTLNGTSYVTNVISAQAATDLNTAFNSLTSVACGTTISNSLGSLTLTPNVYCTMGAASIAGTLTLDGQGNPNSVFIIKTGIGLTLNNGAKVNLVNSASQCNVYWQVNGALTLSNNSIIRGTVLVNGAINQQQGSSVFGRALTKTGNVTLKNSTATVAFPPIASIISPAGTTTFCTGGSVVLSGNNGGTWTPVASTLSAITVTASGTYYVTNTTDCGSITSNSITITVNPLPTVIVNSETICEGGSALLTASGANTYAWSPSTFLDGTSGASVTSNATVTTVYTVTGTVDNCSASQTSTVTVNALPTATVSANGSVSFCQGGHVVLTASPGNSHSWSNNEAVQSITVTATGDYLCTVTGANGCANTSSFISVVCSSIPTITVNSATICSGSSIVLSASGADTYTWSPSSSLDAPTGTSVIASPSSTTVYTITGTSVDGCVDSTTSSVIVVSNPIVSVNSSTICEGTSAVLTAIGGDTYSWSSGATTASISVSPSTNTSYTVTGSNNGCSASDVAVVTVLFAPAVVANASPASICSGATSTLTATGASTYSWSTGESGTSISVSPGGNTNYMVIGTAGNGCSNTESVNVAVISCAGTTQLTSASCGSTLTSLDQIVYFNSVAGATNYKLEIVNDQQPFNVINIRYNSVNHFKMSWISGIHYGRTYKIRVSAYVNSVWSQWGAICTITTPSVIPATQFASNSCGITISSLDQTLNFAPILGASNYRIEITNGSQPFNVINVRYNNLTTFKLSWVTGIQYNRTYNMRISAFVSGTWQPFGNNCSVTTPSTIPTTQLDVNSCGITVSALNEIFYWNPVLGATGYKAEIINSTQPFNVVNVRNNNLTKFALSYVSGTTTGTTYNIRVAPNVGGVWGDYGPMCQVTVGSIYEVKNYFYKMKDSTLLYEEAELQANIYPNPNMGIFTIELSVDRQVEISNILGEKITEQLLVSGQNRISLEDQPNGIYFVKIMSDNKQEILKIIKEN